MKSNLYTRTGDDGTTSLVGGARVKKNCRRLESYGALDELSSYLGLAAANPACPEDLKDEIRKIQNELFNLGAYLATAVEPGATPCCRSLADGRRMHELESWIDRLDAATPPIRAFVLPGGCQLAAELHVARVACRRQERALVSLAEDEFVDPAVRAYINRLSDYLFAAARYANFVAGVEEVIWQQ